MLDEERFRIRPGENIEKVKYRLSKYQYIYNRDGDHESLQYYCTKCGDKTRLITLRFVNGELHVIENKQAASIF